ncbi:MAG: sulfite exporter TauE/SafE family protein [Gammaproteobacteria bacterium]
MPTAISIAGLIVLGIAVGTLIGGMGIGGVLLVPALHYAGGVAVHVAVAGCMFAYLFGGAVGAVSFSRRGSIRWSMAGALCAGAMPGAYFGARTLSITPAVTIEMVIAALALMSGWQARRRREASGKVARPIGKLALGAIGAATGYGSALSGTGGPLLLVPMLLWLGTPVLTAVGLSQVIQLPIAALATAGNLQFGQVDFVLGGALAVLLMIGVGIGARVAHAVATATLKRVVALMLIGVGGAMALRIAYRAVTG